MKLPASSSSARAPPSPVPNRSARRWTAAIWALGVATLGAIALGQGKPILGAVPAAAAPAAVALVAWALCRLPLRWCASGLIVLVLSVDRTTDAEGAWHSPLALVGNLLDTSIGSIFPAANGLKLSGMEILLLAMLVVAATRRHLQLDDVDARDRVPGARVMRALMMLYLASIAYATVNGLATGGTGEYTRLQTRPLLQTALCFFAFEVAFRGPRDHLLLGRLIVIPACIKATLALYVRYVVLPTLPAPRPQYVTNHGDSILFALACMVLIAHLMERTDRARLARCGLILPLLLLGMHANNRRVSWIELGVGLVAAFLLVPWTRIWKRVLSRRLIYAAPALLLYVAVGWSVQSPVTAPVRILRSVVDTKSDRSAWNRQLENWNLAMSMRARPLAGLGFGHEWTEYYLQDPITQVFPQYHAEPHNMILGWLLFMGVVGFTGLWALPAGTVFLSIRAYRRASEPEDRAAALCCVACVLVLSVQSFGDLGPFWTQFRVCGALAFVVAGKLATATGAWLTPQASPAPQRRLKPLPSTSGLSIRAPNSSPALRRKNAGDPCRSG